MARRGVFKPPYAAARAFIEWAVDLWPYVNGKALVSGLRLKEMEASEMVDVLHYYFEEDLSVSTAEQQQARSESRSVVYRTLYGKPYKYATPKSGGTASGGYSADGSILPDDGFYGDLTPFDPSEDVTKPVKPFVPATEMDADSPLPFGRVLDAPLN
jgi:hypothetical protein